QNSGRERSRTAKQNTRLAVHRERQSSEPARCDAMLRPMPHRSRFTHIRPSLSPSFSERVQSENDSAGCGIIAPKNATITRRPVNILVPPLQRPQVQFLTEPSLTNRDTVAIHFNNIRHAYPLAYLPAPNLRSTKKFSLLIF